MDKEAGKRVAPFQSELDSLLEEEKLDKGRVENSKRKKAEFAVRLKRQEAEMEDSGKRLENLAEKIAKDTRDREEAAKNVEVMESEVS